jgi:hypothetical protein
MSICTHSVLHLIESFQFSGFLRQMYELSSIGGVCFEEALNRFLYRLRQE